MKIKGGHDKIVIVTDEPSCSHHWIIEAPRGPWSLGTCKKCKKIDAFRNALDNIGWNPSPRNGKPKEADASMPTKEEFLAQQEPPPKFKKYETSFKIKIVQEVAVHGRTKTRKRHSLPETTLRGWIKRYGETRE